MQIFCFFFGNFRELKNFETNVPNSCRRMSEAKKITQLFNSQENYSLKKKTTKIKLTFNLN
jgi:hypothetical protein